MLTCVGGVARQGPLDKKVSRSRGNGTFHSKPRATSAMSRLGHARQDRASGGVFPTASPGCSALCVRERGPRVASEGRFGWAQAVAGCYRVLCCQTAGGSSLQACYTRGGARGCPKARRVPHRVTLCSKEEWLSRARRLSQPVPSLRGISCRSAAMADISGSGEPGRRAGDAGSWDGCSACSCGETCHGLGRTSSCQCGRLGAVVSTRMHPSTQTHPRSNGTAAFTRIVSP
jgi:hypothetical protein